MMRSANILRRARPLLCAAALLVACSGADGSDLFENGGRAGSAGTPTSGAPSAGAPASAAGSPSGGTGSQAAGSGGRVPLAGSGGGVATAGSGGSPATDAGAPGGGEPSEPNGEAGAPSGGSGTGSAGHAGAGQAGSSPATGGSGPAGGGGGCEGNAAELCDGIDNDCDGEADNGAECPSGCVGATANGRGYMLCMQVERTFSDAHETCARADMHLAWIESEEENAAVLALVSDASPDAERVWLGGADAHEEGDWHWFDGDGSAQAGFWEGGLAEDGGQPVDGNYVNWGEGRPNDDEQSTVEDCLNFTLDRSRLEAGTWNDDDCDTRWPFICEAE